MKASIRSGVMAAGLAAGWIVTAAAHPGWGLVRDPVRKIVYYTDLARVWMIDSAGRRTVAVADVHTHELLLEADGSLVGEDLQGIGENRWHHRIWRRSPDGQITDLVPWREGFRDDHGLVQDGRGARYWASCSAATDRCQIKRRLPNGRVEQAARGAAFARPTNFLAPGPDGSILVGDGPDLKRITRDDRLETVATGLSRDRGRFAIMGIQAEPDGSIYLAGFEDREVVRLDRTGRRTVVVRSTAPWQPSAALPSPQGLWITEYDGSKVRLRLVPIAGPERTYLPQ